MQTFLFYTEHLTMSDKSVIVTQEVHCCLHKGGNI